MFLLPFALFFPFPPFLHVFLLEPFIFPIGHPSTQTIVLHNIYRFKCYEWRKGELTTTSSNEFQSSERNLIHQHGNKSAEHYFYPGLYIVQFDHPPPPPSILIFFPQKLEEGLEPPRKFEFITQKDAFLRHFPPF